MFKTQDLHVREIVRLSSPRAIKELFPAMTETTATVVQVAMGVIISDFFITRLFIFLYW